MEGKLVAIDTTSPIPSLILGYKTEIIKFLEFCIILFKNKFCT